MKGTLSSLSINSIKFRTTSFKRFYFELTKQRGKRKYFESSPWNNTVRPLPQKPFIHHYYRDYSMAPHEPPSGVDHRAKISLDFRSRRRQSGILLSGIVSRLKSSLGRRGRRRSPARYRDSCSPSVRLKFPPLKRLEAPCPRPGRMTMTRSARARARLVIHRSSH